MLIYIFNIYINLTKKHMKKQQKIVNVYQFRSQDRYWRGLISDDLQYLGMAYEEDVDKWLEEHKSDLVEEYDKSIDLYDGHMDCEEYNRTILANSSEVEDFDREVRVLVLSYDADPSDLPMI